MLNKIENPIVNFHTKMSLMRNILSGAQSHSTKNIFLLIYLSFSYPRKQRQKGDHRYLKQKRKENYLIHMAYLVYRLY
jgi:hypothetical protein